MALRYVKPSTLRGPANVRNGSDLPVGIGSESRRSRRRGTAQMNGAFLEALEFPLWRFLVAPLRPPVLSPEADILKERGGVLQTLTTRRGHSKLKREERVKMSLSE